MEKTRPAHLVRYDLQKQLRTQHPDQASAYTTQQPAEKDDGEGDKGRRNKEAYQRADVAQRDHKTQMPVTISCPVSPQYRANAGTDTGHDIDQAQADGAAFTDGEILLGNLDLHDLIEAYYHQAEHTFLDGDRESVDVPAQVCQTVEVLSKAPP